MVKIIIIYKNTDYKSINLKDEVNYENELYKKVGLKKKDDLKIQHTWKCKNTKGLYELVLYGKTNGRSGNENKFEFPPPIDNTLFYGSCIIIKIENKILKDLTEDEWKIAYEKFYGGFEDLTKTLEEDENEEDELDNISAEMKTKAGYLKDGFVVDGDGDGDDDENDEDDENEDEDESENDDDDDEEDDENEESEKNDSDEDSDNGSELVEEPYIFSDED